MESTQKKSKNKVIKDRSKSLKQVWEDLHPTLADSYTVKDWNNARFFVYDEVEAAMKANKRLVCIDSSDISNLTGDIIEWLDRVHGLKSSQKLFSVGMNPSTHDEMFVRRLVIEW